ncbi:hypothetical protein MNBD_CHLOROFLEXI01-2586 [hydrothermal vent metagenome]|uniref:Uncharacterized protein n=1 Tax=hydrothermal vent metagenome TaxID=652676 RepID=A0A3B0VKU3_9ZZZZ
MFMPIGYLISLILIAFLLGLVTVPLLIFVILKSPARMQPKIAVVNSQK